VFSHPKFHVFENKSTVCFSVHFFKNCCGITSVLVRCGAFFFIHGVCLFRVMQVEYEVVYLSTEISENVRVSCETLFFTSLSVCSAKKDLQ